MKGMFWAYLTFAALPALAEPSIAWQGWSKDLFDRAAHQNRFVLLDLEAVWCHWCHVMAETTYKDPVVVRLVNERFIPVRVDQDERPDLSNRYEDYGWPATVIFDAKGRELVTFAGYIAPPRMAGLLQGVIDDPTPGPSVASEKPLQAAENPSLPGALRKSLEDLVVSSYDNEHGGWGFVHKYLTADSIEYSIERARAGDKSAELRARKTLSLVRKLIDPVWGGLSQYSDGGVWENPHFEKIMSFQASGITTFALAYAAFHDPDDLRSARQIHGYLSGFLKSSEGIFFTSQDADLVPGEHSAEYYTLSDLERRQKGLPRVDTHLYARENGLAGLGVVSLYTVTGENALLEEAVKAGRWLVAERRRHDGGFKHDREDPAGPYLGDTLAAGRLFLSLYSATGDRVWLKRAEEAARFIDHEFRGEVGFLTAKATSPGERIRPERDENVSLARFSNLLAEYTGTEDLREMARHAMRYLSSEGVAQRFEPASVLLADRELQGPPLHITVVGKRDDPLSQDLLKAALAAPLPYKRVELWDRREGPLPRPDTPFPELGTAAAYLCAEGRCSAPARTGDALRARLARLENSFNRSAGQEPSSRR